MPCPTEPELAQLPGLGIGLVVSLLEGNRGNYALPTGLRLVRLPIDDGEPPAEAHFPLVARLCALMRQFRLQPRPANGVVVHCLHGRGRTGLLLACYRTYLAVRDPADPEAMPPAEAIAEVDRQLRQLYGTAVTALGVDQVRWVAQFSRRLRSEWNGQWERLAEAEVEWQRVEPGLGHTLTGALWHCPDCKGVVARLGEDESTPAWCPSCGWPTDP
jgi:rubrerythrin